MDTFIFILEILAIDLVPVFVAVIVYFCFEYFKPIKKLNKWWKQGIIALIFSCLCVTSYYVAVPVQISNGNYTYVGNGTVLPVLTSLVFGGPCGLVVSFVGAMYRGLTFNDYLRIPVVISLVCSGVIGFLARSFLYKNKRTKWYNAALTAIFVETLNFLFIFILSNDTTKAYDVLTTIDIVCAIGAAITLALSMIFINIVDKYILKNINNQKKSKSMATKIQHHLFIVTAVTLVVVSVSSFYINDKKGDDNVKEQLRLSDLFISTSFNYVYSINTYRDAKQEKGMRYSKICEYETILKYGYPYIVYGDNTVPLKESSQYASFNNGDIISTIENKADQIGKPFKLDDGRTIFNFTDKELSYHNSDGSNVINLLTLKKDGRGYYATIFKEETYPAFGSTDVRYYYIVSLADIVEVDAAIGTSFRMAIYTQILAFLALFAAVNILLQKIVVDKISQVNSSLDKITEGNLNEIVSASGNKEIEKLSNNINLTVDSLKRYAKKVELKMEEDLELAKKIQTTSVPTLFPIVKRYEIYATMHTAKEVGGDFYDYITIDDSRVMFLVADVSGKGIPAALFMMRAKTLVKSLVMTGIPLEEVVKRANNELCNDNVAGLFVTMWIGIMNTARGDITYVNCGHCAPIVRINGSYSYIRSRHNFVLGVIPGFEFKSDTLTLNQEDLLLLYTDGVTEATNSRFELYGEERLIKVVESSAIKAFDCHQLLDILNDEINIFQKDVEQADDITMLALKYLGDINDSVSHELTLHNDTKDILSATNFVKTFMYKNGASSTSIRKFITAIDEIFANKAKYAYQKKKGVIKLKVSIENRVIKVVFIDQGVKFDPTSYINKDGTKLGLKIVKSCVDNMHYERKGNENILTLEKNI